MRGRSGFCSPPLMWQVCRYCGRQHWSPPAQLLRFFNQNLIDKLKGSNTEEYILCSILWKEIDLVGSQTYNYWTFTSPKDLFIRCTYILWNCPSLGKKDNIKSKTLQLGCDKLLVKWALSSGRGSDNGREDYGWVSFAKSPTSACRCARNIWEIKNQCKNNLDVYTICRNLF